MSELPITKNEYDKSVILINFLSEFKLKTKDNKNIENVVFLPENQGYRIAFYYNNVSSVILLTLNKSKFTVKMKVEYIKGNEETKTFLSKSKEDNQEILNLILPNEN
ncbi:MAG: hypothetical protein UGF89_01305 [Acutalibacteraceae bacterium]|nr:hypothetical protein [Acutalibacteraceae bacterium]